MGLPKLLQLPESGISSYDQNFLQKTMETIILNLSDSQFSVESLGNKLNLSRMQLYRKLVAITGQTPNKLIRNIRLSKAAELLAARTGNVTEIAFEVGFNNLSYFAKCFQDQFGISPSEYIEKT
jgi:AraC-like DNA-binding protein